MNWMTTAKKRVGKNSKKAKREESSRLGAWMKIQQPSRADNVNLFGKSDGKLALQSLESSDLHMLRKLQPAKKTLKHQQAGELSSCSIQCHNKKMKNDNVLISSLDLSPIKPAGKCDYESEQHLDQDLIQEFSECQIINFYNDGERCDESGRVMNLLSQAGGKRHTSDFQQSKNGTTMTTMTPSSSISVLSDRNKWWNRTLQKLTACVEAPVVDYIKLDLQLKDVSLHGCTDIFKLVSAENSDAVAIQVNPAFTTRQVLQSLYKAINHLRMNMDSLSAILDLIRYLEIVDKQNSEPVESTSNIDNTSTPRTMMESSSRALPPNLVKMKPKIAVPPQLEPLEKDSATMEDWNLFGLKSISSLSTGEMADDGRADRNDEPHRAPTRNPFLDSTVIPGRGRPESSPCKSLLKQTVKASPSSLQPTPEKDNPCDFLTDLSFYQFD